MNVRVYDEDGNEAEILSLSENKPTHKEFSVRLKYSNQSQNKERDL